jgi:hypothetical protein
MGGEYRKYRWSKDLLNPNCPQFALHTINRGYGWVTEKGNFSINMDANSYPENTYKLPELRTQRNICHSYMSLIYDEYKEL